jgi:putative transposase
LSKRRDIAKRLVSQGKISLRIALSATNVQKASYYYTSKESIDKRKRPLDLELVEKIRNISGYELTYGYRKVTKKLKIYNHKKIYRHMNTLNRLQPKKIKKKRTNRLPISCPIESNIRWEGDLTYVWDGAKINYLFVILDVFDKEPIGDYYGLRCRAAEAVHSLEDAVQTRFGNLNSCDEMRVTLRVDQGSQYISKKFKKRARQLGVHLEYCGINCPNDKPYVESFFSRYKCEEVYRNEYRSFTHAFLGWLEYKNWYKTNRIHQGLGWMSIPEFKEQRFLQIQTAF